MGHFGHPAAARVMPITLAAISESNSWTRAPSVTVTAQRAERGRYEGAARPVKAEVGLPSGIVRSGPQDGGAAGVSNWLRLIARHANWTRHPEFASGSNSSLGPSEADGPGARLLSLEPTCSIVRRTPAMPASPVLNRRYWRASRVRTEIWRGRDLIAKWATTRLATKP